MSDECYENSLSGGSLVDPDRSGYREVTSKYLRRKYSHPLYLPENRLTAHYTDIEENMFGIIFKDLYQELECSWILDIQTDIKDLDSLPGWKRQADAVMVCEFISEDIIKVEQKARRDEIFYEALITRHYLWMLEKLIQFCMDKGTRMLMFIFREKYKNYLEIYNPYIVYEKEIRRRNGKDTYAAVKACSQTYDTVIESLYKLEQQFRQHLWRYQKGNSRLRSYLKSNPL